MNLEELEKIKQNALNRHIPIIMDDTLEVIKEYLEISNPRKDYLIITFITAFLYKVFLLLMPFLASWIIKYATNRFIQV